MVADDKLAAAYHLAIGSRDTAKDLKDLLRSLADHHPIIAEEMLRLAENCDLISELLVEAGFKP